MSSMYPCFAEAQQLFSLPHGTFWYEGFILLIVLLKDACKKAIGDLLVLHQHLLLCITRWPL